MYHYILVVSRGVGSGTTEVVRWHLPDVTVEVTLTWSTPRWDSPVLGCYFHFKEHLSALLPSTNVHLDAWLHRNTIIPCNSSIGCMLDIYFDENRGTLK